MKLEPSLTGLFQYQDPTAGPYRHDPAEFASILSRALASEPVNETPEGPQTPVGGRLGQPPPRPGREDASASAPSTEGAGNLPPINRRPPVGAAPDPDEIRRVVHLLHEIRTTPLLARSDAELNDFASAMRDVLQGNAPRWLKQECRVALNNLVEAGGIPRPPMSAIARAAAAPSLGMKAGVGLASLINWLPADQLGAIPAAQRDSLFAKYRELRADPQLNDWGQDRTFNAVSRACEQLLTAGASLILDDTLTAWDSIDIGRSSPAPLTKAFAARTDQQLTGLSVKVAAYSILSNGAPGMPEEVRAAAQVQADRVLTLNSVPSRMQPLVERALEDFPGLNPSMRLAVFSRPEGLGGRANPEQFINVTTGAPPAELQTYLDQGNRNAAMNVVFAKIALMDDYMIDQSASGLRPYIRRPGEETFKLYYSEASVLAPPGTQIRIGQPFTANFAQFTLPPMS